MFLAQLFSNPIGAIMYLIAIVIAITVHEFAHAKVADHLGDPTPDLAGRVTLNPKAHLDPLGSVLFLIMGFGWGKPVPFDPYNLENPARDAAKISFAGPLSNAIMAIIAALLLRIVAPQGLEALVSPSVFQIASATFLTTFIFVNLVLGVFNLIPVAPLDGFKIVGGLLPEDKVDEWYSLERYGTIFLILMILPFTGGRSMVEAIVSPIVGFLVGVLL